MPNRNRFKEIVALPANNFAIYSRDKDLDGLAWDKGSVFLVGD